MLQDGSTREEMCLEATVHDAWTIKFGCKMSPTGSCAWSLVALFWEGYGTLRREPCWRKLVNGGGP